MHTSGETELAKHIIYKSSDLKVVVHFYIKAQHINIMYINKCDNFGNRIYNPYCLQHLGIKADNITTVV